jgi:hypothetical protein
LPSDLTEPGPLATYADLDDAIHHFATDYDLVLRNIADEFFKNIRR